MSDILEKMASSFSMKALRIFILGERPVLDESNIGLERKMGTGVQGKGRTIDRTRKNFKDFNIRQFRQKQW